MPTNWSHSVNYWTWLPMRLQSGITRIDSYRNLHLLSLSFDKTYSTMNKWKGNLLIPKLFSFSSSHSFRNQEGNKIFLFLFSLSSYIFFFFYFPFNFHTSDHKALRQNLIPGQPCNYSNLLLRILLLIFLMFCFLPRNFKLLVIAKVNFIISFIISP